MAERISGVKASVGFASETGPRKRNEDFAGAVFGSELPRAAPRRGGGDRRRNWRRQGRPRGGRDRGARLSGRILRPARDHGSAPRGGEGPQCAQWLDLFPRLSATPSWREWDAPSPRWCCAAASRMCCMSATPAPIGCSGDRLTCLTTDHVREDGAGRSTRPYPRARCRDGGAAGLRHPAGGAARPLPAVQRRCARIPQRRDHRRHPRERPASEIPPGRWLPPRSTPAAPTILRLWCRCCPRAPLGGNRPRSGAAIMQCR